jgi:hypothetical protein
MPRQLLPPAPPVMLLLAQRQLLLLWHGTPACAASSVHAGTQVSSTYSSHSAPQVINITACCAVRHNLMEEIGRGVLVYMNMC